MEKEHLRGDPEIEKNIDYDAIERGEGRYIITTCVHSPKRCLEAVIPHRVESGNGCAAKLSATAAKEYQPLGIRCLYKLTTARSSDRVWSR